MWALVPGLENTGILGECTHTLVGCLVGPGVGSGVDLLVGGD